MTEPKNTRDNVSALGKAYLLPKKERSPATDVKLTLPFARDTAGRVRALCLGFNRDGFDRNALLLGSIGCGKTNVLKTLISSAQLNYRPEDLNIWVADDDGVEYRRFDEGMVKNFSTRLHGEEGVLDALYAEFERRVRVLRAAKEPNILWYWSHMHAGEGRPPLPRLLFIADNTPDSWFRKMDSRGKLDKMFRMSHAAGINFLFAGQPYGYALGFLPRFCNIYLVMRGGFEPGLEEFPESAAETVRDQVDTLENGELFLINNGGHYGAVEKLAVPFMGL